MRTLEIIEYVVAADRPAAAEIAAALVIPDSSLSYLLATLVEHGFLAREGRRYAPGPALARLQPSRAQSLAEHAQPLVRSLRVQLGETASFFVRRGWEVETLVTETSEHALRYATRVGTRTSLHGFSAGKAILAALPDAEVEAFLAQTDRQAFTPATIVSRDGLLAEVALVRRTRIARTRGEHTPGIEGVGCAAMTPDGELLGAFSVAVPSVRFDTDVERRAATLLTRAAALLAG